MVLGILKFDGENGGGDFVFLFLSDTPMRLKCSRFASRIVATIVFFTVLSFKSAENSTNCS